MSIQETIQNTIKASINISHLEVENESHQHNVPPGSESHFKLVVVSDDFQGMSLVKRHQTIYKLLASQMSGGIHALALHTFTQQEWQGKQAGATTSPACMGGSSPEK